MQKKYLQTSAIALALCAGFVSQAFCAQKISPPAVEDLVPNLQGMTFRPGFKMTSNGPCLGYVASVAVETEGIEGIKRWWLGVLESQDGTNNQRVQLRLHSLSVRPNYERGTSLLGAKYWLSGNSYSLGLSTEVPNTGWTVKDDNSFECE